MSKKPEKPPIMIGADPEVAVYNRSRKMFVSPWDILPGTKDDPFELEGGACQVDGMAAEFNVDPMPLPQAGNGVFYKHCHDVMAQMLAEIQKRTDDEIELHIQAGATFDKAYFNSLPKEIRKVGCDPDFRGYNGTELLSPVRDTDNTRYFGGHVHVGWGSEINTKDPMHIAECGFLTSMMSSDPWSWQTNDLNQYYSDRTNSTITWHIRRRDLYGTRFRPKSYGVELRQYSNIWLRDPYYINTIIARIDHHIKTLDKEGSQYSPLEL